MTELPLSHAVATEQTSLLHNNIKNKENLLRKEEELIGWWGSFSIAVNSLTGPAMLTLPVTFLQCGILPTTLCILLVCAITTVTSMHLCSSITAVNSTSNTSMVEVEYSQVFGMVMKSQRWYLATQVAFYLTVTCLNISSIVDTAQVLDSLMGQIYQTVAIAWDPQQQLHWQTWQAGHNTTTVPFADATFFVSSGKVIVTLSFLPLSLMDLQDNVVWQIIAFCLLLVTWTLFAVHFLAHKSTTISWWGTSSSLHNLLGVVLFNFPLVLALPAWLSEKAPHVSVERVVRGSCWTSAVFYITTGWLGAVAMPHVEDNMLESILANEFGRVMQAAAAVFAIAIVGLGIPLLSVVTRMNLRGTSRGGLSRGVANILAVYVPFGVAWILSSGAQVTALLEWGGTVCLSLVAYIFPLILAMRTVEEYYEKTTIRVYRGLWESRKEQLWSLRALLAVTVALVITAIVGNLID